MVQYALVPSYTYVDYSLIDCYWKTVARFSSLVLPSLFYEATYFMSLHVHIKAEVYTLLSNVSLLVGEVSLFISTLFINVSINPQHGGASVFLVHNVVNLFPMDDELMNSLKLCRTYFTLKTCGT